MIFLIAALCGVLCGVIFLPKEVEQYYRKNSFAKLVDFLSGRSSSETQQKGLYHSVIKPRVNRMLRILHINMGRKQTSVLQQRLIYAKLDHRYSPEDFLVVRILCAGGMATYFTMINLVDASTIKLISGIAATVIAYMLPDDWLKRKAKKRQDSIVKELPAVLNALAITTEAGLNLLPAIQEVCERNKGTLVDELEITLREISLGKSQADSFRTMAERCGVAELTLFISVLIQSMEKGAAGVALVLKDQARQSWLQRKQKAEELGAKASGKLFFPMIAFTFPATMMVVIGPAVINFIKDFF